MIPQLANPHRLTFGRGDPAGTFITDRLSAAHIAASGPGLRFCTTPPLAVRPAGSLPLIPQALTQMNAERLEREKHGLELEGAGFKKETIPTGPPIAGLP